MHLHLLNLNCLEWKNLLKRDIYSGYSRKKLFPYNPFSFHSMEKTFSISVHSASNIVCFPKKHHNLIESRKVKPNMF